MFGIPYFSYQPSLNSGPGIHVMPINSMEYCLGYPQGQVRPLNLSVILLAPKKVPNIHDNK
jgi:hypothetical protein